jgi:hypothetical protein
MSNDSKTSCLQAPEIFLAIAWMLIEALFLTFEVTAGILRNKQNLLYFKDFWARLNLTGVVGGGGVVVLPAFLFLFDSGRLVVVVAFALCLGLLEPIAFLDGTPLLRRRNITFKIVIKCYDVT